MQLFSDSMKLEEHLVFHATNKKIPIELNRCAMACEGCGAVFSLT